MTSQHTPSRRTVLTGAAALTAAVLGTTDLHGNVFNWDYFKNAEFDNSAHDDIGIAKAATLIRAARHRLGRQPVLTLDAGDTIQGTPLAHYYARIDPITGGATHPMTNAMNLVGYDAAALGNHEFNYGIDTLRTFESQLDFPLLGANAVDPATGRPVFPPYVIKRFEVPGAPDLKVGVLGLTNPGIAIWDKANVEGRMEFPGLVEQASKFVPEQVPGVDAILLGHAHKEIPQRFVTNAKTGRDVLVVEPLYWGMRVAVMDLDLRHVDDAWTVVGSHGQTLNSNKVAGDPAVLAAVREQHETVVGYVNSPIGTSAAAMTAARAVVEDAPIIDLVQFVQADAVKAGLTGADAALPVLSIAAPFNRAASFPAGQVTVRDVAGLYIYDNTLLGVKVTGAQVKDYLEYSARYFQQVSGPGPLTMAQVTNAVTTTAPNGTPDYSFDSVAGLDAPVAYNRQNEIRQLIIDWVTAHGVIDPAQFASVDWHLASGGQPIVVS